MCGIVGSITNKNGNQIVLNGLKRLEYRGYDSCGIFYIKDGENHLYKSIERITSLERQVNDEASLALGHTRWATHGKVTLDNAHPHVTHDEKMIMVHNGVIENFKELKDKYCSDINLKSQTDTEVILETLYYFYKETKDMKKAFQRFIEEVKGSYACIIYNADEANNLYVIKNKSPLLIGKNEDVLSVSSDVVAMVDEDLEFFALEDKTFGVLNKSMKVQVFDKDLIECDVVFEKMEINFEEADKSNFEDFMLKEIYDQPHVMEAIVNNYRNIPIDQEMLEELKSSSKIYIVASGTSLNSGFATKRLIEDKLKIPVECAIGSEFGYDKNLIPDNSFFIFLSQSGETADSLLVLNKIKGKYKTLAITNVLGSQIDRICDYSLQLYAGVEMSVASTKAYTAQICVLLIIINQCIRNENIYDDILKSAEIMKQILASGTELEQLANKIFKFKQVLYLGRLGDYALCQEAALKLKEITYINVNAMQAGELKHGTISLVDETMLSIFIINDKSISKQIRSNVEEVRARGGEVIIISNSNTYETQDDYVIELVDINEEMLCLFSVLPHQLLAYYSAKKLELDVDKPRNLAKSVTVE